MPIGAAIGGAVVSGGLGFLGASKAAKAQKKAAGKAADTQLEMFNLARGDLAPYRAAGLPALNSMLSMYGLTPGSTAFGDKEMAAFRASPDYQVSLREGLRALDNSAASRGMLKSGGTIKGTMGFASDLATRKLDDYMSRLYQMAGIGENAASQSGNQAISTGNSLANTYLGAGEAQAAGYVGGFNALGGAASNIGDSLAYYLSKNPSAYGTPPSIY